MPVKLVDFAEFARMVLEVIGAAFSVVTFILLDNGGRAKLVVSSLSKTPISGTLVVVLSSILGAVGTICAKTVVGGWYAELAVNIFFVRRITVFFVMIDLLDITEVGWLFSGN